MMELFRNIYLRALISIKEMTGFVTVISSIIETGFRKIKIRLFGNYDLRTPRQATPFGIDSSPYKGMIAIYADTYKKGKPVIIGYLNKSLLAADGETRLYSLKEDGTLSTFVWLKADGKMYLGGDAHNAVRFDPLKTGLNNLVTGINTELTKIQVAITGLGGAYSKVDVSVNVDAAKIDEIKTL